MPISVGRALLGAVAGLVLSASVLVALFLSPLRKPLYFQADPEITSLREKLAGYQDRLSQADLGVAEKGLSGSDSLQNAQARIWREYRQSRTRLAELARDHERATPSGFGKWAFSLRYWAAPPALVLAAAPALLLLGLGLRDRRSKPGPEQKRAAALSSFRETVKKVARISDPGRETEFLPKGWSELDKGRVPPRAPAPPMPREKLSSAERETEPFPITQAGAEAPPLEEADPYGAPALSMEDEDGNTRLAAEEGEEEDGEEEAAGNFMPPTTEVERVERRKALVLKLARKGLTSSEISRRLRISQDQVEFIIRLRRERGA